MSDLYLSQQEANILRYATLVWGAFQWWDLIDRYIFKQKTSTTAAASGAREPNQNREGNLLVEGTQEEQAEARD